MLAQSVRVQSETRVLGSPIFMRLRTHVVRIYRKKLGTYILSSLTYP